MWFVSVSCLRDQVYPGLYKCCLSYHKNWIKPNIKLNALVLKNLQTIMLEKTVKKTTPDSSDLEVSGREFRSLTEGSDSVPYQSA